jgi:CxxC motif-containing protein (DUF1111 family)
LVVVSDDSQHNLAVRIQQVAAANPYAHAYMARALLELAGGTDHGPGPDQREEDVMKDTVATNFALLALGMVIGAGNAFAQTAVDHGPRGGAAGAGAPIANLTDDQLRFFANSLAQFKEVEDVKLPSPGNGGLGPTFNGNACAMCHSQPDIGGTSPAVNPQVAVATFMNALNTLPFFVTPTGPVREARFKFFYSSPGDGQRNFFGSFFESRSGAALDLDDPDGGVHDLFTIAGRTDAPAGCTAQVLPQPDFNQAQADNNLTLRIPTPVFGLGLIETISDYTILHSFALTAPLRAALGIRGSPNRSGNDGTITRFGWKAQNKSGLLFAGEAYNVEMGITNELFPNERGFGGVPPPLACVGNLQPEDQTNLLPNGSDTSNVPSDIEDFAIFMRLLDQPTPSCTTSGPAPTCSASIQDGLAQFKAAGCALCHTPSMMTDASDFAPGLSNTPVNLFSDLLLHHMGEGLNDGITQGAAGPDQFRTAPLWGIGQRLFFLHDGRTSDLLTAIKAHASRGSEANAVIRNFNGFTAIQQQDLLDFLRSL